MRAYANFDRLSGLVGTIGSTAFDTQFYQAFRDILSADECTVFTFKDRARPARLIAESDLDENRSLAIRLADDYVSDGFRADPYVLSADPASAIWIRDARDIADTGYRKHYYELPQLSQKLVILAAADQDLYYINFYRRVGRHCFGKGEIKTAQMLRKFMVRALHRHCELSKRDVQTPTCLIGQAQGGDPEDAISHICRILLGRPEKLSSREAEICAAIVLGFSTTAISMRCSISPHTVATHRKRAYAKLGISSQNELFARYLMSARH